MLKKMYFFVIIFAAQISGAADGDAEEKGGELIVERSMYSDKQNQLALQNDFKALNQGDKLLWLGEGDDKFLVLMHQRLTAEPQGAVLLFHDNGQTADWPQPISKLRNMLPDNGWMTLSISLPEMPKVKTKRELLLPEDNSDEKESGESEVKSPESAVDIMDDYHAKVLNRITLLHEYAIDKGMFNTVWVGAGQSTWWMGQYMSQKLQETQAEGYFAIFYNADAPNNHKMSDILVSLNIPILDIYQADYSYSDDLAKTRKASASRNGNSFYQQILETRQAHFNSAYSDRLVRRIWGWIRTNAGGQTANLKVN